MEGSRIDAFAKALATSRSRRSLLKIAGAALGATAALRGFRADAAVVLRGPGQICRKASECTTGLCSAPDRTGRSRCICPAGQEVCGSVCVNPATAYQSDATNCGACGKRCAAGDVCCDGACAPATSACGGICCAANQVCVGTACCTPELPTTTCNGGCGTKTNNCGQPVDCGPCCAAAGTPCITNGNCCSNVCVNGSCQTGPVVNGQPCDEPGDCLSGACCGGRCVDPASFATDPLNCGSCGTVCAGDVTECAEPACVGGGCATSYAPAGTPTAPQTPGDCHASVCDGEGNVVFVVDDTDTPTDDGGCAAGICVSGIPAFVPKSAGAPCSQDGGSVCDGAGHCVPCLTDEDCPGGVCRPDNTCCTPASASTACAGRCGSVSDDCGGTIDCGPCCTAAGDPCAANDDCCSGVCTEGACQPGPVVNGQPCDEDADCQSETCCNDVCVDPATFATDVENCGACGVVCAGEPTECSTPICLDGACATSDTPYGTPLASQTPGDCQTLVCDGEGGTTSIADDTDVPHDGGSACMEPICVAGSPASQPKPAGAPCDENGGTVCDGAGACVECVAGTDCASGLCLADATCCVPDADALTCEGRCGSVLNNCEQTVDCDPCCVEDPIEVTCAGQCGPVLSNCDNEVDCGPCCDAGYELGSDGATCVPTEATCNATIDSASYIPDADFRECNFAAYELTNKYLIRCDFSGASLAGVSFVRTNLSGSNFDGADLSGVNWALAICPDDYAIPAFSGETCCGHLNGATPAACS